MRPALARVEDAAPPDEQEEEEVPVFFSCIRRRWLWLSLHFLRIENVMCPPLYMGPRAFGGSFVEL